MEHLASILETHRQYGPFLKGVFAVTNGGRMLCADYTNIDIQNAYFEGFTRNMEVTNLFVWNSLARSSTRRVTTPVAGMKRSWLAFLVFIFLRSRIYDTAGLRYPWGQCIRKEP